jgi:hypothetical protein
MRRHYLWTLIAAAALLLAIGLGSCGNADGGATGGGYSAPDPFGPINGRLAALRGGNIGDDPQNDVGLSIANTSGAITSVTAAAAGYRGWDWAGNGSRELALMWTRRNDEDYKNIKKALTAYLKLKDQSGTDVSGTGYERTTYQYPADDGSYSCVVSYAVSVANLTDNNDPLFPPGFILVVFYKPPAG